MGRFLGDKFHQHNAAPREGPVGEAMNEDDTLEENVNRYCEIARFLAAHASQPEYREIARRFFLVSLEHSWPEMPDESKVIMFGATRAMPELVIIAMEIGEEAQLLMDPGSKHWHSATRRAAVDAALEDLLDRRPDQSRLQAIESAYLFPRRQRNPLAQRAAKLRMLRLAQEAVLRRIPDWFK